MKRTTLGAVLVLAMGALVAACGGDEAEPVSAATTAPTTAAVASQEPQGTAAASPTASAPTATPKPNEKAEDAFRRQLGFLEKGQSGRAYDELHPAQQAVIPRDVYMRCVDAGGGFTIERVKVEETYEETIRIPGTTVDAASTAITAEITMKRGLQSATFTDTFHEFLVDGAWRFTASAGDAMKDGRCE